MNAIRLLLHSPAFWTALFSAAGLIGLKYLHIPEDVWNVVLGLMVSVVTILTAEGASESLARNLIRSQREDKEALRLNEKG